MQCTSYIFIFEHKFSTPIAFVYHRIHQEKIANWDNGVAQTDKKWANSLSSMTSSNGKEISTNTKTKKVDEVTVVTCLRHTETWSSVADTKRIDSAQNKTNNHKDNTHGNCSEIAQT